MKILKIIRHKKGLNKYKDCNGKDREYTIQNSLTTIKVFNKYIFYFKI